MTTNIRLFDAPDNTLASSKDMKINCHDCGIVISPVAGHIYHTEIRKYYLGTYCRLCIVIPDSLDQFCLCLLNQMFEVKLDGEIKKAVYIWMYDKKDDMEHKIHPKNIEERI